jgi:hypothetical protein
MPHQRRPRNWDDRTAHVGPLEPGDVRYVAHIEGRRSVVDRHNEPFEDVRAAVVWARERAPVVLVRLDGEDFLRSAGERPFEAEPWLPPWPPQSSSA